MFDVIKEILILKKEFTETNSEIKCFDLHKNNLIDCDDGLYLAIQLCHAMIVNEK